MCPVRLSQETKLVLSCQICPPSRVMFPFGGYSFASATSPSHNSAFGMDDEVVAAAVHLEKYTIASGSGAALTNVIGYRLVLNQILYALIK